MWGGGGGAYNRMFFFCLFVLYWKVLYSAEEKSVRLAP